MTEISTASPVVRVMARGSAIRVLIADDQPLVSEALTRFITSLKGFMVVAQARDSEGLWSHARRLRPTIVLADAVLPDIFVAIQKIRSHSSRTRVVLLDEFPVELRLRRAYESGAAAYLTKHDSVGSIQASLKRVAIGQRVFPEHCRRNALPLHGEGSNGHAPQLSVLTPRELQVLSRLAAGYTVKRCASALEISVNTVDNHKSNIMNKLGMHKTVDLTRFALRNGLVME